MPTYDYSCQSCGYEYEVFHGINQKPDLKCPQCGGQVERKISGGTGLLFKGSGFYITDYKKNNGDKEPTKKTEEKPKKQSEEKKTSKTEKA